MIRKAVVNDAKAIHEAHMRSIRDICSKAHTKEEIQAWGNRPFRELQRIEAIKKDEV